MTGRGPGGALVLFESLAFEPASRPRDGGFARRCLGELGPSLRLPKLPGEACR